ncbi:P-loop containing nucleoside triphosphate hydrolase protein [Myxozyma melibiosi]|uniref:P-loop containing nucleoside triphosphate hydrolase protein n=1 Tax=Myxozyma melibiosi TaxID=54550 RepID=A0ABR1F6P2_9ASCO
MPQEFSYGVLENNHTSGILLYGPPGTGKTLLVKALAKAGHTSILEVRPGDVLDMYVGESEKNVQALFSLARKLSPAIIFIDEVEALFRNRTASHHTNKGHRNMLNQFMVEWDGLRSEKVMLVGATNRPFDLDDAILRRFPRRILVDLPLEKTREEIFRVHLKGEQLDESTVSLSRLAQETKFFSGSDIKNVCISAALMAVKEIKQKIDSGEIAPADAANQKRTLEWRHFEFALKQTGSSISDDMSSITMIREWDREFGQDRKKKAEVKPWGFSRETPSADIAVRPEDR